MEQKKWEARERAKAKKAWKQKLLEMEEEDAEENFDDLLNEHSTTGDPEQFTTLEALEKARGSSRCPDVALLDANWILRMHGDHPTYVLSPRQLLEQEHPEAFFRGKLTKDPPPTVIVMSYPWLTESHPDPRGFHFAIVATFLQKYKAFEGHQVALLWDFASIYQPHLPGCSEREEKKVRKALRHMNVWYGNSHTHVWRQPMSPTADLDEQKYWDSGWCFFELACAAVSTPPKGSLDLGSVMSSTETRQEATVTLDVEEACRDLPQALSKLGIERRDQLTIQPEGIRIRYGLKGLQQLRHLLDFEMERGTTHLTIVRFRELENTSSVCIESFKTWSPNQTSPEMSIAEYCTIPAAFPLSPQDFEEELRTKRFSKESERPILAKLYAELFSTMYNCGNAIEYVNSTFGCRPISELSRVLSLSQYLIMHLDLTFSDFSGDITDLTSYGTSGGVPVRATLETLNLSHTMISGDIGQVGLACRRLHTLCLRECPNIYGELIDLNVLLFLEKVDMYKCKRIVGDVDVLAGCRKLKYLDISESSVTGTLGELGESCRGLEEIYTNDVQLQGDASGLSGLPLRHVDLFGSNILGALTTFEASIGLRSLDVRKTKISGNVSALWQLVNLREFYATGELVKGDIDMFSGFEHLQVLGLYGTDVTGPIECLRSCNALQRVNLQRTRVTGDKEKLQIFLPACEIFL